MIALVLELETAPDLAPDALAAEASRRFRAPLGLKRILKRSLDARKKDRLVARWRAVFEVAARDRDRLVKAGAEVWVPEAAERPGRAVHRPRVVVVGTGPAGLFCALRLAERGLACTVLEQGKAVADRHRDVERLRQEGILDPWSNIVFGEGGAGTYSDGKLTTRIHKPGISWVFDRLVDHGAPPQILYDAKPHVGTDRLSEVTVSIRRRLEALGTRVAFGQRVTGVEVDRGRCVGVKTADGTIWPADAVVLACGHSARDLFEALPGAGVRLEPKALAVGVRVEHPASFINASQYGAWAPRLPAADYRLAFNDPTTGRGTYSFCMCPGGEVVNSSSEPGRLCVNGMSHYRRDLATSNAALVTSVGVEDFAPGPLGGVAFQRALEEAAFRAGGGGQRAPLCPARDFVARRAPGALPEVSYRPGGEAAEFDAFLPPFVAEGLRRALTDWDRRLPGFVDQGILIGVETRTSSPVRILRGDDFQALGVRGLYPAGEGAGYAGGIVSAAVDGVRIADALAGVVD